MVNAMTSEVSAWTPQATTDAFIEGLRHATARQRFQISTDGFQPYQKLNHDHD